MMKPEQVHSEEAYDSEQGAREGSRLLAVDLIDSLRERGYRHFHPPVRPHSEWMCDEFGDCRILIAWIDFGRPTVHAGKFLVRVDTLAS